MFLQDREDLTIQCCPYSIKQRVIIKWFAQELHCSSPQRLHPHLLVTSAVMKMIGILIRSRFSFDWSSKPDIPGMRMSAIRHAVRFCSPEFKNSSADANARAGKSRLFHQAMQCAPHQLVIIDDCNQFRPLLSATLIKLNPIEKASAIMLWYKTEEERCSRGGRNQSHREVTRSAGNAVT